MINQERIDTVIRAYRAYDSTGIPTQEMWDRLSTLEETQAVTLVNYFRFRAQAAYPADFQGEDPAVTGRQAFDRYAAVSGNCLTRAGGRFLLVAPYGGAFIGGDESWDLVAIGTYPNPTAILSLFEQPEYRSIYVHRTAACSAQRVSLCLG